MRQGNSNRRQRGRSNRRNNNQPNRNLVYDSNGPGIRVRGNAQQVMEKYMALARDAQASGNHVQAEAFFQHGEHYLRIHLANQASIEETRARKQAQREERQARQSTTGAEQEGAVSTDEAQMTLDTQVEMDQESTTEAEVVVAAFDSTPRLDPSQQEQPDVGGVEVLSEFAEAPEAISLFPPAEANEEGAVSVKAR